mmetsp:Transcript_21525/g.39378  ORF Transcript_21525/g.39378 Transcript_21525/m.39378 type:complete len:290 (-) Transcript_21525:1550-2419(-)
MARLEGYAALTKKQDDLFKNGFVYGTFGLAVFSHQTSDILFKTRVGKRLGGPVISNMSGQYKHGDFSFTPKHKTDGSHLLSFEYNPDKDNKLKGELKLITDATGAVASNEPSLTIEHQQDNARVKVALTAGPSAKLNGTFGRSDIGLGVETKLALNALALPLLNIAGWYNFGSTNTVVKFEGWDLTSHTVEKVVGSVFLGVSPAVRFGSLLNFNLAKNTATAEFGGEYQLSENTLVKGKFDNSGTIGLALQQQLNSNVKLSLASQVSSAKVVGSALSDFKFGFRFDFKD